MTGADVADLENRLKTGYFDAYVDDSGESYVFEVDLEYPREQHDAHADLPFVQFTKFRLGVTTKSSCSFWNTAKNIYCIIEISSPWLKEYIMLNSKLRTEAANDFGKDFFKFMNTANFGKTMENVRNY